MISVVIPYKASRYGDTELRHMLRSVEKHLRSYGTIFLLGKAPAWLQNVIVVPTIDIDRILDKTYQKERAIYDKIRIACYMKEVTDDFLFMNDDHFLLQDFDAGDFPLHWSGGIETEAQRPDIYSQTCKNTLSQLYELRAPTFNYDTHCPIVYNKKRFLKLEQLDWGKKWGYCIKTVYCAMNGLHGAMYDDLKIRTGMQQKDVEHLLSNRLYFSTDDKVMDGWVPAMLKTIYPNKSKFER